MDYDLTCVITGHREGRVAVASLRSFAIAIADAEACGLRVEALYYLDNPDDLTREMFKRYARSSSQIVELSLADQGLVRNAAVDRAGGRLTAFLDGDDLWARTWLSTAVAFLRAQPGRVIAHPQYNYFFESTATIFCHQDEEEASFDLDLLRVVNYWDALCVCETQLYRDFPFSKRAMDDGWAYEDWFWNCETVAAGVRHKIVPNTILFKRRQKLSQTIRASTNKSRIRVNPLSSYSFPLYPEPVQKSVR